MLQQNNSESSSLPLDRETRINQLLARLRDLSEPQLRRMAEALVDLPDDQLFGAIEYTLRDAALQVAADAHHTGLQARKKGAT